MKEVGMMLLSQAAQALGARLIGEDARFFAVSSDSRKMQPGDLFIALRGEHFLHRGFAITAGDRHQRNIELLAPVRRELSQRETRIFYDQDRGLWIED